MKKLILILQLVFVTSTYAQDTSVFSALDPQNSQDRKILMARQNAIRMIEQFVASLSPTANTKALQTMIYGLQETPVTKRNTNPVRSNADKNMCDNTEHSIQAYVPFIPFFKQVIRLCRTSLNLDVNQLTQVFIHEAFHLNEGLQQTYSNPIDSEAGAVKIEMIIMKKLVGCSYLSDEYYSDPEFRPALAREKVELLPLCN